MASSTFSSNVALAGECMVCRPFALHGDEASMSVIGAWRLR